MRKLNNKGFTLVEIIAVIVIIAVLGLIAVPNVLKSIEKSRQASYDIMIEDIIVAGKQLFDEIDYGKNELYHYNLYGNKTTKIEYRTDYIEGIEEQSIKTNKKNELSNTVYKPENKKNPTNIGNYLDLPHIIKTIDNLSLQTLVSNSLLTGTNNPDKNGANKNNKIITNPKTKEDIGDCKINIQKITYATKDNSFSITTYNFTSSTTNDQEKCPTTEEYKEITSKYTE